MKLFTALFIKNTFPEPRPNQEHFDLEFNAFQPEISRHVVLTYISLCGIM